MAGEFSLAGTKFTIGTKQITGLLSFPDMGSSPQKIKVTSMDDTENERYIAGLKDTNNFDFEFNMQDTNYDDADSLVGQKDLPYSLELPNGSKFDWTGEHVVFLSSGAVGGNGKFKISCTVNSKIEHTKSA